MFMIKIISEPVLTASANFYFSAGSSLVAIAKSVTIIYTSQIDRRHGFHEAALVFDL